MIHSETLAFLTKLEKNNNLSWFNAHKEQYEMALINFKSLITAVLEKLSLFDHHLMNLEADDCLFPIHRKGEESLECRFSAYMAFGGRNSEYAGYYLYISPKESFLGGGMYKPNTAVLKKIRQEIDVHAPVLKAIIESPKFKQLFGDIDGEREESAPHAFPKDHPNLELLRLKSFFAIQQFSRSQIQSEVFEDDILEACEVLYPFNQFFNETFVS